MKKTLSVHCMTLILATLYSSGHVAMGSDAPPVASKQSREWAPNFPWADDTDEWIAALRKPDSDAGFACATGMGQVNWRVLLWELRQSLKEHSHPGAVYAQQVRLFSSLPVLLEQKKLVLEKEDAQGCAKYREACVELAKRAGVTVDLKQMDAETAHLVASVDWEAVAKYKDDNGNPRWRELQEPPSSMLPKQLAEELKTALKGHPHPEKVWLRELDMIGYFFPRSLTMHEWYEGRCMNELAALGLPSTVKFFEKHISNPQAAKAWFDIQWPRLKIQERKRAVIEGLGCLRIYDTKGADGDLVRAQPKYFPDPHDPLASLQLDLGVIKPRVLDLGRAIRPEIHGIFRMHWSTQTSEDTILEVKWFAELAKRPEFAPTDREMDALLTAQDAEGRGVHTLGKAVLAINLIGTDDDQRFSRTVNADDGLWDLKEYEEHVRKVYARAIPEVKKRMYKGISEYCFGERGRFYDSEGRIWPKPGSFEGRRLDIIQSLNDPEFLKQLHQMKSDVEAAANDVKRWQAGPNPWEKADPEAPVRLRNFVKENLDPAIKALESGQLLPAEKFAKSQGKP